MQRDAPPLYVLRLYVTGMTERSSRAIRNLKRICEQRLPGRYDLEVIDLYEHPLLAASAGIAATPTVVKSLPAPVRRLIGDLSDEQTVLRALDLGSTRN
jgi:circadian clock protein KaiB